jgi:uncharacterized membrane protein YkoI
MLKKVLIGTSIAATLVAGGLLGSSVLGADHGQRASKTTAQMESQNGNEQDDQTAVDGVAKITPDEAKAAALTQFPGATINGVELENEDGSLVYNVKLTADGKAYEVKIDANTGTVLRTEADEPDGDNENSQEGEQDEANEQPSPTEASITADQAKAAALAQFPGATIGDVQLEDEDGSLVYSVELRVDGKAQEVKVDATTGTVLRTEADEPDGED